MRGSRLARWGLLLPAVGFLLAMSIFPLVFSLALSLGDWELGRDSSYEWRGLSNFEQLLGDQRYRTAAFNTIIYVVVSVAFQYVIGLALAWGLYRRPPGHRVLQVLLLVPMMLTPVAVGYMWRLMFQSRIGAVNYFLDSIGIDPVGWLTGRWSAMSVIVVAEVWQWTPFMFVFLYAALLNLPRDPVEAALVDGAGSWQVFRRVILPMLAPISIALVMLRAVESLKIMDTIYVTTHGGPGNDTESLTLYAYNTGLQYFNLGYSAAIAVTLLVVVVLAALPIIIFVKRDVEVG